MKRILGLDLGTTSIGWAVVEEAENQEEKSSIIRVGSRVNPLTVDEKANFEKGKPITTNADRTLKRGMRRNNQRYKQRRDNLRDLMLEQGWITDETILAEHGNRTTFETLHLRAKAAEQEISLEELARVLLNINKKRGYKSNRKADNKDEGQTIDGLTVAKELHRLNITPGQFIYRRMQAGKYNVPDFYRSDLTDEFDRIWNVQSKYYPTLLTDALKENLKDKNKGQTWGVCREHLGVVGIKRATKGKELNKENYEWRAKAISEKIGLEELTIVLQNINGQIQDSGSYLGKISDRHKELFFHNMTVGQYQIKRLDEDPNVSLKNTVFYRQDYIDEFEKIWTVQAKYHPELTAALKKQISDTIIFYQRPLKSQKGLVSTCEFESYKKLIDVNGEKKLKTIGLKVCPKSSPLFQEFKVWQTVNNISFHGNSLTQEQKNLLFSELNSKYKLTLTEAAKLLGGKSASDLNYKKDLDGNSTQARLIDSYWVILEDCGYERANFTKKSASEIYKIIEDIFKSLNYKTDFLHFDACLEGPAYEEQPAYKLWHLIYSYEGDKSASGTEGLVGKIRELTGFSEEHAQIVAQVSFAPDYGNLSSKAIRKIMPYLKQGYVYSDACELAGYRHSKSSLTKEELDAKQLKDHLDILPKNSLRNPVVEKILNQMVNVVNEIIDTYGKPDEIRLELARELKKSAKERQEMTDGISKATKRNEVYRDYISKEFNIPNPSRNDILKYRLYEELSSNSYKTLYSNKEIHVENLFTGKDYDIEHIIPQAKLFDDSFANKTLETRQINLDKGNSTAYDFVKERYGENGLKEYIDNVNKLYKEGAISKAKKEHLLMPEANIPSDFINRDLRDTQYIAKQAKSMLEELVRDVVTTTGTITDRLREDWQLVNVMQELNWDKYEKLGLTEYYIDNDGRRIPRIKDWTKRNDHRHHAVDALIIAFTKRSYIQYLNNLNARVQKENESDSYVDLSNKSLSDLPYAQRHQAVKAIEKSQLTRDNKGKLRFIPPMPVDEFRAEAKRQLESCLVSIKAKNRVVSKNRIKCNDDQYIINNDLKNYRIIPRGQLHKETYYGTIKRYCTKVEKIDSNFSEDKIATVTNKSYREALLKRLESNNYDSKKAFTGKNSPKKSPIYLDDSHISYVPEKVKTVNLSLEYTSRIAINPKLDIDKVVDTGIQRILRERLAKYGNNANNAFSDLEQNPIWLNKDKGIKIKEVTVMGACDRNAVALHKKIDYNGDPLLNIDGEYIHTDYVNTSNNHHIAIFRDLTGNLQEVQTSFFEAVKRAKTGKPIIDKYYRLEDGWKFLFTMKQNEYFVFPNAEQHFDPNNIDLLNPKNYSIISPNLFRVQNVSSKDYVFRHHLETTVDKNMKLRDVTWKRITNVNGLKGIVKVRVNHIGQIVQVGEY